MQHNLRLCGVKRGLQRRIIADIADNRVHILRNISDFNKDGDVGGFSEYPVTIAPALASTLHSHEPLKPVCPVTNTFLP